MPNLAHKNHIAAELKKKIAVEGAKLMPKDKSKALVLLNSIQPGEQHKNLYFSGRMHQEVEKEVGAWKNDKSLLPAPAEHEQAIIDLCATNDSLTKEIVSDVLANGTVAEKLELLKIIQGGKRAMVKENNSLRIAKITASAKPKAAPSANVQVNVDRRGISVNGGDRPSPARVVESSPAPASSTIPQNPEHGETQPKSPLDSEEA